MERSGLYGFLGTLLLLSTFSLCKAQGVPTLEDTPLEPLLAVAGDAVLIDCVVKNLNNYTIIWRRAVPGSNKTEIISAGEVRIIPDSRFALLHHPGHETWVLQIQPAQVNDSGRYICEVNTSPRMQMFRMLSVVERISPGSKAAFPIDHNYTNCCVNEGVPSSCLDFCSLQSVIMGGHPEPWNCMEFLPTITRCLTDDRNHMPCCLRKKIPEVCRSVCVGDYGLSTVRQHYGCMEHTIATLSCIAEGIEILPGPPKDVTAEAISPTEIKIRWTPPHQSPVVNNYQINVTLVRDLASLEGLDSGMGNQKKSLKPPIKSWDSASFKSFMTVVVDANKTSYVVSDLQPTTMYEVVMVSNNSQGTSMPTYSIRVLTQSDSKSGNSPMISGNVTLPSLHLPNITKCCEKKGVPTGQCLTSLCDPSHNEETRLSDVIMCAPWVNITFECMAGGADHSQCCHQRGLPDVCLDFCRGNISHLDIRHFVCLEHIDVYGNCLLEFYGVLPGPPEGFLVTVVHSHWAVLRWSPPSVLSDSVNGYVLYWKEVVMDEIVEYNVVSNVTSPYLLDNLKPRTRYEVYVAARNELGVSRGSARAVFTTSAAQNASDFQELHKTKPPPVYNETACCVAAGLRKGCLDLCTYNMKMSDLQLLAVPCANQLDILVRCGAGGRDHSTCCQRQGVRWECVPVCSAVLDMTPQALVSTCVADAGKILQCMSEGVNILPPAPEDVHAINILPRTAHIKWNFTKTSDDPVWFEVRYSETKEKIPPRPLEFDYSKNVTEKEAVLRDLKGGTHYCIYVVARNEHGTSLPSLILIIRTPEREDLYNETFSASIGPPNYVEVTQQTMNTLSVMWHPSHYLKSDSSVSYIVFYQHANSTDDIEMSKTSVSTIYHSVVLANLTVNTQYAIAVKAVTYHHESPLSEIILAWTDPAIPAFLNPPVIVPPDPIVEGANVTILCVATGMPVPVVSLFLNGQLMIQQQQSHVAYILPNINHHITKVDCFADNGLGQGAQSSMKIEVNFQPTVQAMEKRVLVEEGSSVSLRCLVAGHPEPRVLWYRDRKLREPLTRGPEIDLSMKPYKEKPYSYVATLTFLVTTSINEGQYFCHAENHYGKDTILMNLEVLHKLYSNASACCEERGVSAECQEACSFDIDIESALNKPKCFKDLDKLMYCAADDSDHRKCCRDQGIHRSCLRWCQGRPIVNVHLCIVHASKIVNCFEKGKSVLPGPPQNIQLQQISSGSLKITWDPPHKNPKFVQWYKISYRNSDSRVMFRNITKVPTILLQGLEPGSKYEVAVKAGNHYGMSLPSETFSFTFSDASDINRISAESVTYESNSALKTAAAVVSACLLLVLIGAVAIYMFMKFRQKPPPGIAPGVSFENPTYMKENSIPPNAASLNSSSETNHCDNRKETTQT